MTRAVIATLIGAARQSGAHECCGLLLGQSGSKALIPVPLIPGPFITVAQPAANDHPLPARFFEIDPAVLIAAYRAERGGGPALLGFYHSHPGGHPRPSAIDCEHAGGDGRIWAIIARDAVRLWRDTAAGFVAVAYQVVDA